jgi:hypothetical protein
MRDRRHPAFNKLFIQSEYVPDLNGLLFWRRPRSEGRAARSIYCTFFCRPMARR